LVETSMDKAFETAKTFILDGLSSRLVNFEKTFRMNESFKAGPRTKYPSLNDASMP
jgi:hypothetical protein